MNTPAARFDLEAWKTIFDDRLKVEDGRVRFEGREIPERNGILRFTPDISYSTGNFSRLRERHSRLQLDSVNGTGDRLKTILERTGWPREFFKDKLILECGSGAGADAEVLLSLGARVVSVDLAGSDICRANVGPLPESLVVQASIADLPFRKQAFDIVWCHRVLQHTPDPKGILRHMLSFVKQDGAVFIHSYARNLTQMVSWKYALRPLTRRMDSESLYRRVERWVPALYHFTNALKRTRPALLGKVLFRLADHIVPIRNYRFEPKFAHQSDEFMIEYAIHDTYDALSPRYDSPVSAAFFHKTAISRLHRAYEVHETPGMTLLRTRV
jgi:2-polyprenyl-3-methyl-5-hydroxy-6-metoxy-1,4-benzoquinol methylase